MSFLVHRWRRRKGVAGRSWRPFKMRVAAAISAIAMCGAAGAQENDPSSASSPPLSVTGRVIATELSPEVKRVIDAARRFYETPGLILDRMAIYEAFEVHPKDTQRYKSLSGARNMNEILNPKKGHEGPHWKANLSYYEYPEINSWSVRVKFDIDDAEKCYSSRLVESYWGQTFVYRPLGTHALLRDLARPDGVLPTGPHDGEPYKADFFSGYPDKANLSFSLGKGGCLLAISLGNLFKIKDHNNDNIYH